MTSNKWNVSDAVRFENFSGLNILVTGGHGFVGKHVIEELIKNGATQDKILVPRSKDCDLRIAENANAVVKGKDLIIHLAARVGGIGFNQSCPADLIYDNTMMGMNIIHAASKEKVKKLVVAGTVCAYPKFTPTPFQESALWDGYPEETNASYGIAKKTLLVALQAYRKQHGLRGIYLLPANLYGPFDNFDLESSHVIPALIRKFVTAKKNHSPTVEIWGDGSPSREFLFVDDIAKGIALAALKYDGPEPVNMGTHEETTIKYLVETIKNLTGFEGSLVWDASRPGGQPKRQLDTSRALEAFGFRAETDLKSGLKKTIQWFQESF